MSIQARQHIPSFFDGFDPKEATAATTHDLLAVPWIAQWTKNPKFTRWSVSDGTHLMAEMKNGTEWWVVAYLSGDAVALPVWHAPSREPTS